MLCFGLGGERRNFLSLVCNQQIENRELFHSVCFLLLHPPYSSSFHHALLITLFNDTALSFTKLLHLMFESMNYDHLSSPIHTQSHRFSCFAHSLQEHIAVLNSLQSVPSVGLSGCYLCPLSLRKGGQDTKGC